VTDALQNIILQRADIRIFIRHYGLEVFVDIQGTIRKTVSQTPLARLACSLSASIDPDQPYWLSADESKSLNQPPETRKRHQAVMERKEKWKNRETKLGTQPGKDWIQLASSQVRSGLGLVSSRTSERLHQVDRIRAKGVGGHIALPQLVVRGDQSAGDSFSSPG
jgi:hypothetical protein